MKILLTGGAGFIGSNLLEELLADDRVELVRVMDNLSTGDFDNIAVFSSHPKFQFHETDICNLDACLAGAEGMDRICHQAALGSVPRSVKDPIRTNNINVNGTLNIFRSAVELGIDRVVFASSSSVYGDNPTLPKIEEKTGKALSPYALTKQIKEYYAEVFARSYDFNYIALRYFNIFGPKQSPEGQYAAVIPIFMEKAIRNESPIINGDGNFSRDFTYISNAVMANINALFTTNPSALNEAYNIACGERTTLNELWSNIQEIAGSNAEAIHGPERAGDIPHSLANISKANTLLDYKVNLGIKEGLQKSFSWYQTRQEAEV